MHHTNEKANFQELKQAKQIKLSQATAVRTCKGAHSNTVK
ncbi:hypothetical protein APHNP_0309 [Anaplasma phagocytophilum str. ApNP]|uniref:Uncharacterized protein n=2 Tax=Anaplasma phagocytophilum TaxID=948 RepID=A0A0F3NF35_ANAPH|nr:hypothetical protein APHMUC_0530 [Anaplasma phagocytophilum str. ApMUC09]KJV66678.1 hypothetical protein APHNP_0309 [Anaplasma phagocytophilum str. ApNP]